jgi:hypothetical protein
MTGVQSTLHRLTQTAVTAVMVRLPATVMALQDLPQSLPGVFVQ